MRILKFGGKSVSTVEKINQLAEKVALQIQEAKSHKLIVVISAMGETTSNLLKLSSDVHPNEASSLANRELDMLLASGERVSAALFALALQKHGIPSKSFTGSQAGILTTGQHSDSTIQKITPMRLDACLQEGIIPVVAGFQGVDPTTKDVTTLGRGGTDLTACALAHHYNCQAELYKTVGGIFTCDPHLVPDAKNIQDIDFDFLQAISSWGAKILHDKAADFAKHNSVEIGFYSDQDFQCNTKVQPQTSHLQFAITCMNTVLAIKIPNNSIPEATAKMTSIFKDMHFKILASAFNENDSRFLISTTEKDKAFILENPEVEILNSSLVAVSALFNKPQEEKVLTNLTSQLADFSIQRLLETQKRLTFFIDSTKKMELVSKLHSILS